MSDLQFTQYDTGPSLFGTLTVAGQAVDLTGCTVKLQMRLETESRVRVEGDAVVVDADTGSVRYDWAEGDLAMVGDYAVRWLITYPDQTKQHSDPANSITVTRI